MSTRNLFKAGAFALIGLGVALSGNANASTATANMSVSATVVATCSVSAGSMAFGSYSGAAVTSSADLSVTCTNDAPYTIALGAGSGTDATTSARLLTNASDSTSTLSYGLYQDSSYATTWGDTTGTDTLAGTGTGAAQTVTVYGKVAADQLTASTGSYSDTVVVTVNY
ncbi:MULTISPECIES: Csu type fimbrial protein [Pseudomonas]|uniref:Spore coat protein U domain-containing protein n=1 Tax=Pseudomonas eucalypticola TaxID=2599595 RepID=A0A7D5D7W4_9PSED|nr:MULTISPECIES: spore coat U domain-containing protein [Pseudomonas]QKZ04335.1 spore coat protein U domain-containing protein [Pseudomonas eucalypticola]